MIIKVNDLGATSHDGNMNVQNINKDALFEGGVKLNTWKNSWVGSLVDLQRCVYQVNLGVQGTQNQFNQFVRTTINITYVQAEQEKNTTVDVTHNKTFTLPYNNLNDFPCSNTHMWYHPGVFGFMWFLPQDQN